MMAQVSYSFDEDALFKSAFEHSAIGMALVGGEGCWLKVNRPYAVGRFTYNFPNPEKIGLLNTSTYYVKEGDPRFPWLGRGCPLPEVLPKNTEMVTVNGEYKQFYANYDTAAFADPGCFCMFDGKS